MVSNSAAWITAARAYPFEVKPAPLGVPEDNQILIKNHAIAINPVDGKIQSENLFSLKMPTILGLDVAGEVVAVGPRVARFKKGDRVTGLGAGFRTGRGEEKAFQAYTILESDMACKIPDNISFENAVVLPLGVSTAASALFNSDFFNLQLANFPPQNPIGKTLLVWGGALSVGSNAIQLAVAAGYEVITTASEKNHGYVKMLGASQVFDYNSPTVVSDLVSAFDGKTSLGVFDAIGEGAWTRPLEFLQNMVGGTKFMTTVTPGYPNPEGIVIKLTQALSIKGNGVGKAVWEDFLQKALDAGAYITAPEPLIAGKGLESLQDAVDLERRGTSARKIVVQL
ncbi:hypothetical protein OIDMADRAFT_23737 [Oidiodendron maius Zn]|uniref:Enoyl reductase (ER) domain-containing protein n=1 Tax=Oidiodendron maius (strain Zn) TaxID=913774 RepID=A0A0C3I3P2_OIDMZ|nr:hypothetical protein OIDMADRAFT_23737 [Oidiodendron maius Zn]